METQVQACAYMCASLTVRLFVCVLCLCVHLCPCVRLCLCVCSAMSSNLQRKEDKYEALSRFGVLWSRLPEGRKGSAGLGSKHRAY